MPITDIVTPAYIRQNLLANVITLATQRGATMSDDAIWAAIDEAVNYLESEFGLALTQTVFKEEHTRTRVTQFSQETYQMQTMLKRPIQRVDRLSTMLGTQEWYNLPVEWVHLQSKEQAVIHLIPNSRGTFPTSTQGVSLWNIWFTAGPYLPGYFRVSYRAGFEEELPWQVEVFDGERQVTVTGMGPEDDLRQVLFAREWVRVGDFVYRVERVQRDSFTLTQTHTQDDFRGTVEVLRYDSDILSYVAYAAAMPILATLGAAVYGFGVIGTSIKLDGLAQSKNLNPRGPFANLMDTFKEKMEAAKSSLYSKYAPINIALIG